MIFNQSKLNKHWKIMALSELGDFNRGKSKHRPRNDPKLFQNGIYPFIQTGDIKEANLYLDCHTENYNEFGLKQSKLWKENTLCITIAANIAETALLKYPMCFPDSVVGFTAYEGVSSELFMHYIFTFIKKSIQSAASGSIQDNINIDFLTKLKFRIPSKIEQDKIAAVLSALDKKIALNKQINARLEEMAKTLYDYWFVQFDFPDANGKPYKSSGGEMVFDETLKREIPKGWEVKSLGDWAEIRKGTLITEKTANTNGDIKVISAGVDFSYYHDVANRPKNTITISASGANAGFVNFWREPIFACDCTTITNSVIGRTLYILNFLKIVQDFIYQQARGSAQPHVYPKDIEGLKIIVPPDSLLKKFSEFVDNWNLKIANNEKQNHQLTQLRDFLLPMLMNGQVSVAE
ncbi:TPA: restriction endonuclease subunit S [Neisseria subflava]